MLPAFSLGFFNSSRVEFPTCERVVKVKTAGNIPELPEYRLLFHSRIINPLWVSCRDHLNCLCMSQTHLWGSGAYVTIRGVQCMQTTNRWCHRLTGIYVTEPDCVCCGVHFLMTNSCFAGTCGITFKCRYPMNMNDLTENYSVNKSPSVVIMCCNLLSTTTVRFLDCSSLFGF